MSADRREPPAELRGVDGWHWVQNAEHPSYPKFWNGTNACWEDDFGGSQTPEEIQEDFPNLRYLHPVSPHDPAAVAALVKAAATLLDGISGNGSRLTVSAEHRDAMIATLSPFPQPKDTDNAV